MNVYTYLLVGLVVYFLLLAWIFRDRPLNDTDRYCSEVDRQLDVARARQARRVARQQDRVRSVSVLSDARRVHKR